MPESHSEKVIAKDKSVTYFCFFGKKMWANFRNNFTQLTPVNCELFLCCHSFTEIWGCPSLYRSGLLKESGNQSRTVKYLCFRCCFVTMELYSMGNSWIFCAGAGLWWSLLDPFQLRMSWNTSPYPTAREIETQRCCVQGDLLTGNLPLTRLWGKRSREKECSPASIVSRKYSQVHEGDSSFPSPGLHGWRLLIDHKEENPRGGEWSWLQLRCWTFGFSKRKRKMTARGKDRTRLWERPTQNHRLSAWLQLQNQTASANGGGLRGCGSCSKWGWSQGMWELLMDYPQPLRRPRNAPCTATDSGSRGSLGRAGI